MSLCSAVYFTCPVCEANALGKETYLKDMSSTSSCIYNN